MNLVNPPPDAPVYEETPGAAVFKMICINCHGPLADGNGPLAANLNIVTGGAAQVANFRAGLFGPQASPEADINSIFGTSAMNSIFMSKGFPPALLSAAEADWTGTASAPTTADDRAARYMPWMALGGTTVNIPEGILQLVAVTKVLGEQRVLSSGSLSGNMLSAAKELCYGLLGPVLTNGNFVYASWDAMYSYLDQPGLPPVNTSLLKDNGDAELWMRLCAIANPPPIHILRAPHLENGGPLGVSNETGTSPGLFTFSISNDTAGPGALLDSSLWTSLGGSSLGNASPGNPTPSVADSSLVLPTATTVGNLWPWCIDTLLDAAGTPITGTPTAQALTSYIDANNLQALVCPNEVMCTVDACALSGKVDPRPLPSIAPFCTQFGAGAGACFDDTRANQWAVRGAINAGMSVFTYVQSVEKAGGPPPDFDQCSQLK
jgi:mono/diheme cytochrome c family protein